MPTPPPFASRWRNVKHVPIHDQSAVEEEHGALPSRPHPPGQLLGRDTHRLPGCFGDNHRLVILRAHPVGVLNQTPGR